MKAVSGQTLEQLEPQCAHNFPLVEVVGKLAFHIASFFDLGFVPRVEHAGNVMVSFSEHGPEITCVNFDA